MKIQPKGVRFRPFGVRVRVRVRFRPRVMIGWGFRLFPKKKKR
jgi:hypothetical protein